MQPQTNSAKLPIDTLIHLGAGRCRELDRYLNLQCKRLILIEADPQLADALKVRTGGLPQVEIIQAAVAGRPGSALFHRFSLPDVNSLRQATGLFDLFPGLKKIDQLQLETIDPANLLAPLQLHTRVNNLLVVDLPGVELEIIQVLHQAQQLHHFSEIQLHCSNQPLYEGSEPAVTLLRWLEEQGFDMILEDDSQDPDRPCWYLQRNTQLLRNLEQQERMLSLQAQLGQLETAYTQECEKVRQLEASRQTTLTELSQARHKQTMLAEQITNLEATVRDLTRTLAMAREEQAMLVQQVVNQEAAIQEMSQARDEQATLAQRQQERIAQLETQLAELNNKQRVLTEEMIKVESQVDLIKDIFLRESSV